VDSCPNSTKLNENKHICDAIPNFLNGEFSKLLRLNITDISQEQAKTFQDISKIQVLLAESGEIPSDPNILKALDFSFNLELYIYY